MTIYDLGAQCTALSVDLERFGLPPVIFAKGKVPSLDHKKASACGNFRFGRICQRCLLSKWPS